MGRVAAEGCQGGSMNTAFSLLAAGVRVVPPHQQVKSDPLLAGLMVLFFAYVAWLMLTRKDPEP